MSACLVRSATLVGVIASHLGNMIWGALGVGGCAGLWWTARRIDPHWCAQDGRSFTCKIRQLDNLDDGQGRWRDGRATLDDDRVRLTVRGLGAPVDPFHCYELIGKSDGGPKRSAIYVLGSHPSLVLRIPTTSRAVDVLDEVLIRQK